MIVIEDELPDQAAKDERFQKVIQRILEEHKAAFLELAKKKNPESSRKTQMVPGSFVYTC